MYVCMYACMHVCMYVCMYVCKHVCMYVYVCICMYMYVYAYTLTHTHTHNTQMAVGGHTARTHTLMKSTKEVCQPLKVPVYEAFSYECVRP